MAQVPKNPPADLLQRRLAAAADLRGNSDGVADPAELAELAETLQSRPAAEWDADVDARRKSARALARATGEGGVATLAPALRRMPPSVQRMALEVDALWGNADGEVTLAEIDRLAGHYLAAVAFFTDDAKQLLGLADALGIQLDAEQTAPTARNLVALRSATDDLAGSSLDDAKAKRALLDEALAAADIAGSPELTRDASLHSPLWHQLSILEHTTHAVRAVEALKEFVGMTWPDAGGVLLLHDVGKILDRVARTDRGDDHYSYWNHEEVGARWLEARGVNEDVAFHVRHHMDIRPNRAEDIEALCGDDQERLAQMVVVFCADTLAKGAMPGTVDTFDELRPKLLRLSEKAGLDGEALIDKVVALRGEWYADVDKPVFP